MSHLISDFYSMEGNSESNSVKWNSDSNSNSNNGNSNLIPIPTVLGQANSIPIPELDLELARSSNSGAELTPALVIATPLMYFSCWSFFIGVVLYTRSVVQVHGFIDISVSASCPGSRLVDVLVDTTSGHGGGAYL